MTLEQRTRIYLNMAHAGGLATIGALLAYGFDFPDIVKGLTIALMVMPLAVLLIRRLRDEYIESLWQSGTSLAFAGVVLGFVVLPFLEGLYDGVSGNAKSKDIPTATAGYAAIAAFYVGFHIRWLRGLR